MSDHDEPTNQAAGLSTGVPTDREQRMLIGKIVVGALVGIVMTGIVGPIAAAIVIGLATGH
ncbi:MAG TPA: hypothetical protein VMV14_09385 [Acidimicrobiales bacterium]|nr:hypothetical protein [Acidimicrobiales bacterium]